MTAGGRSDPSVEPGLGVVLASGSTDADDGWGTVAVPAENRMPTQAERLSHAVGPCGSWRRSPSSLAPACGAAPEASSPTCAAQTASGSIPVPPVSVRAGPDIGPSGPVLSRAHCSVSLLRRGVPDECPRAIRSTVCAPCRRFRWGRARIVPVARSCRSSRQKSPQLCHRHTQARRNASSAKRRGSAPRPPPPDHPAWPPSPGRGRRRAPLVRGRRPRTASA